MGQGDEQLNGITEAAAPIRKKSRAVRFGMAIVVLTALPFVCRLAFEAAPEKYRPYFAVEKPGAAAVHAVGGPGEPPPTEPAVRHVRTPDFVKGIYVSASTAGNRKRFAELTDFVERTELNSMVIDVKDDRGHLAFAPTTDALKPYAAERPPLGSLGEFTAPLKERGIYLIARIFVFQDPAFAEAHPEWSVARAGGGLWRDYRGIPWLDPASKDVWRHNVAIAREVYAGGFDEVQFDYIRFPSDGNLSSAVYPVWDGLQPKAEVIADLFDFLDKELRAGSGIPISVDLFGLTMWQHDYDLNIGQKLLTALPHFDFVSPMVYPSHYPDGFNGYANPATRPYDVVYQNLARGQLAFERLKSGFGNEKLKLATIRPWIQDFHLGAVYTPEMVRAQMIATVDGNGSGWLLWNARNIYTESALLPEIR